MDQAAAWTDGTSGSGRSLRLDALRGIAIVLVVAGHSVIPTSFEIAIFTFHMPLFALLSGIGLSLASDNDLSCIPLARRARSLLIPYFAWAIVYVGLSSISTIPRHLAVSLANPRISLWFLYVLFGLVLIAWTCGKLPGNPRFWLLAIACAALLTPHFGGIEPYARFQMRPLLEVTAGTQGPTITALNVGSGLFGWRGVQWLLPFFAVGFLMAPNWTRFTGLARVVGSSAVAAASLAALWPIVSTGDWSRVAGWSELPLMGQPYVLLRTSLALSCALILVAASTWIPEVVQSPLAFIGKRSLGIYAVHSLFAGSLEEWPLLSIATTVALSLLVVRVLELMPAAAFFFLGKRWPREETMKSWLPQLALLVVATALLFALFRHPGGAFRVAVMVAALIPCVVILEMRRRGRIQGRPMRQRQS